MTIARKTVDGLLIKPKLTIREKTVKSDDIIKNTLEIRIEQLKSELDAEWDKELPNKMRIKILKERLEENEIYWREILTGETLQ